MESTQSQQQELEAPTSQEEATQRNLALLIDALPEVGVDSVKVDYQGTPGDEWNYDLTDATGINLEADPPRDIKVWVRAGAPDQFELKQYEIIDALEEVSREIIDDTFDNHSQRDQKGVQIRIDLDTRLVTVTNRVEHKEEDYYPIPLGNSTKPTGTSFVAGVSNVADAVKSNLHAVAEALRKAGATQAYASYRGSGDDGSPTEYEHDLIDEDRPVRLCAITANYNHSPNGTTTYDITATDKTVIEAMESLCEELISDHHSGYEDGNGGGGEITFNLEEGDVEYRAFNTVCNTADGSERTVTIPNFVEPEEAGLISDAKASTSPRP